MRVLHCKTRKKKTSCVEVKVGYFWFIWYLVFLMYAPRILQLFNNPEDKKLRKILKIFRKILEHFTEIQSVIEKLIFTKLNMKRFKSQKSGIKIILFFKKRKFGYFIQIFA